MATDLNNLGLLYVLSQRYQEAANIYQRALNIQVKALDPTDPAIAQTMHGYAFALTGLGRKTEAKQMEKRAEAISSPSQSVQGK